MIGYFNGNDKTLWVMTQGLIQTLLVRLPMAYIMSIQPNASLTKIGLAAPVSTAVGIMLKDMTFKELIQSGMQIGKEVTGTTVNTLLFAYLGESLLLFSYLRMQGYSFELLLNSKIMFENCASMIFGAIACEC